MWSVQSDKIKQNKKRVNYTNSTNIRIDRFKELCNKNGLIMSVFVENAINDL